MILFLIENIPNEQHVPVIFVWGRDGYRSEKYYKTISWTDFSTKLTVERNLKKYIE